MGQRTQMVVDVDIVKTNYEDETTDKQHVIGCYHNQWGIGKMQLLDVINLLNTYVDFDGFKLPKRLHKGWLLPDEERITQPNPSIYEVMNYLNQMDNNNGGIYIKINVKDHSIVDGYMCIFNDPEEDSANHSDRDSLDFGVDRIISYKQWRDYYKRYFNRHFDSMFKQTLKFYNIKLIEDVKDFPKPILKAEF